MNVILLAGDVTLCLHSFGGKDSLDKNYDIFSVVSNLSDTQAFELLTFIMGIGIKYLILVQYTMVI